jgi:pimeloyl-ACP methyl ester carboxylesterase
MAAEVLLVHGAWHGGWCFDRVVALLTAAGVPVVAPDLPGHGDDAGPFSDLHGDAERVTAVLDRMSEVILLGHSYGGAVITEAGIHPAVRHLVYLSALALDYGETCSAAAVEESAGISHQGRPDLSESMQFHDHDVSTLLPGAETSLYQDCSAADITWAMARLGPQPMLNLSQEPREVAWRTKPSTYLVCTEDQTIHPDLQRILARRCTTSQEWSTGHSPFLSHPEQVRDLLLSLV